MPKNDPYDDPDDDYESRRRRKKARADKKNRTLYILLAAGAVVLLGCGGVAVFIASAVKQVAQAARDVNRMAAPDRDAGPPTDQVSAEELYKAYEKNEARADGKYRNNSIQVDGIVESVENEPGIGWQVTISTGRNQSRIFAKFSPARGAAVSQLGQGQRCMIIGICCGRVSTFDPFSGIPPNDFEPWGVGLTGCRLAE